MTRDRAMSCWADWCQSLWGQGEPSWIQRDGQDHYYRNTVVIPALIESTIRSQCAPEALVDLGSGDGYTTGLFLTQIERLVKPVGTVVLVDRSRVQLDLALKALPRAKAIESDLTADCWIPLALHAPSPRIFLSIFVLQEIPVLEPFLRNLIRVMSPDDLYLAVIVAPMYSESLRKRGSLEVVDLEGAEFGDWDWAGRYPISTPSGDIFLPHFQRHLSAYQSAFERSSLRIVHCHSLKVPPTRESYEIFSPTAYGRAIVGKRSSMLFVLKRQER